MALISCPECRQSVSDLATACPHCGYIIDSGNDPVVRDRRQWRMIRFLVSFGFLAIIIILVIVLASNP
jgi:predicted amidophosphoribosyltransferase